MQNKEDSIEVSAVVTIYRSTTLRASRNDTFYVEIQNVVTKRKGKPILGAARPITKEAMNNIIDLSRMEEKSNYFSSKLLPENLLSFNPDRHNRSI
ncbi:MAG: hypothetical protein GX567_11910, partial [Clostridia bacterium]|nr:hypothetical protein [Clostridia bacterium]